MSDPGPSFSPGGGSGAVSGGGNPVSDVLVAMCDAWTLALSGLRAAAAGLGSAPMGSGRFPASGDPIAALITAMSSFGGAIGDLAGQAAGPRFSPAGAGSQAQSAAAQAADLAAPMARACLVAAGSTLNYWRSLAEVYARHQATLLQLVAQRSAGDSAVPGAERRLLADELRAYFREVGEVAVREARRLHAELEQIGEAVASATEQPDPSAPPERHWKAKG